MMKPDPNEVVRRGASVRGPRKFLNRSASGEPGGRSGNCCAGTLRVWEGAILTTVGSNLSARSAKESGAGRAKAGPVRTRLASAIRVKSRGMRRNQGRIKDSIAKLIISRHGLFCDFPAPPLFPAALADYTPLMTREEIIRALDQIIDPVSGRSGRLYPLDDPGRDYPR